MGDRIAELYPHVNESENPLPRAWSNQDKYTHIGLLHNNLRAQYKGLNKSSKDAASVRTSHPIPGSCGLYYFEVKIVSKGKNGYIGVGLCAHSVNMNKLPGWEKDSYGYHADDGHSFCASSSGEDYGPTFTTGDTIGCGVNLIDHTCFYTKNGVNLGTAFKDIIADVYPTVGLQTPGEIIDANFGQQPFLFDINEIKKELQTTVLRNIELFPLPSPEATWKNNLQRLIAGYLVHYGYTSTAEAFANSTGETISEDISSIRNRQRIQRLILSGRMSEAIETTRKLYPELLEREKRLSFHLDCRQFIEMVSGSDSESKVNMHTPICSNRNSPFGSPAHCSNSWSFKSNANEDSTNGSESNGNNSQLQCNENIEDEKMDEDEKDDSHVSVITTTSKVLDIGPSIRQLCGGNLMAIENLLQFGKTLQSSYKELVKEMREEQQDEKLLMMEAFSLLAYSNPRESPVSHLLDLSQRETICSKLNSAILESNNLPSKPALEVCIGQTRQLLKTMSRSAIGSSAMLDLESFLCVQNKQ